MAETGKIYELIGQAIGMVGAIGKDSQAKNMAGKVMYNFRGIDQVYNVLNPIFSKLGIFIVPEVLNRTREERQTTNGAMLIYTILDVKFRMFAPDGSFVEGIVAGEAMDSGDKSSNKAMSAALKYFCFQTLCIPTEEMPDPDAEVHDDVLPTGNVASRTGEPRTPAAKQTSVQNRTPAQPAAKQTSVQKPATVEKTDALPITEAMKHIGNERTFMAQLTGRSELEMKTEFEIMRKKLIASGTVPNIKYTDMTLEDAKLLTEAMYANFMSDKRNDAE